MRLLRLMPDRYRKLFAELLAFGFAMNRQGQAAQSNRMREGLADQFTREVDDRGNNLWAVYSTLTYYASHADGHFTLRRTVDDTDTVAQTMLGRELNVARWVQTNEWKEMENA